MPWLCARFLILRVKKTQRKLPGPQPISKQPSQGKATVLAAGDCEGRVSRGCSLGAAEVRRR